jgi:predicted nucleic acid-binding protein
VIVPSSLDLCRTWAAVRYERRARPIDGADAWMAATALTLGCPLVTHNATDYQGIRGLVIITEPGP